MQTGLQVSRLDIVDRAWIVLYFRLILCGVTTAVTGRRCLYVKPNQVCLHLIN